jgi:hypothetical protein
MGALKRLLDDDDEFDPEVYDPRYYPRKVFRDGKGLRTPLMLTDGMPDWMPRRPVFDASAHRPHQARITDAARRRVDDAYAEMVDRNQSAWLWNKQGERAAPVAVGDSPRDEWVRRNENAWRRGAVRYDLDPSYSGFGTLGPEQRVVPRPSDDDGGDNGLDYTTDPGGDDYARSVWAAQNAIAGGRPEAAAQVEATQRRMSMSQPNATAAGVAAERRRFQPRDGASGRALADAAWREMCERNANAWRKP